VGLEKTKPGDMGTILMDKYKIFTAPIDGAGVKGCRISPNVYTSENELDKLVSAIKEMSGNS
jgi:selenocysteine lyase/cysteine desulfurase